MLGIAQIKVGSLSLSNKGIDVDLKKDDWVFLIEYDCSDKHYCITTDSHYPVEDCYWVRSDQLHKILKYKKK